ncbi:MAG: transposase [Oligoflexia bacterium]|nr:transposase [Oligoflexia bacterium]
MAISKHWDDLNVEEQEKLNKLFEYSSMLSTMYQFREELYSIFNKEISVEEAAKKLEEWCECAIFFEPFHSFVTTIKEHESSILNYFKNKRSSGPVEGLNNKVKGIKRRSFGFRNVINFTRRLFFDFNFANTYLVGAN